MATGSRLADWEDLLAEMEAELDHHERALRCGELGLVPAFDEPDHLGPLPEELADRVAHLLSRLQLLQTFVQYQLVAAESDLAHASRTQSFGSTLALYLDATA